jgi:hypothetical protein
VVVRSLRRREVSVLGRNWNQQLFPDDGMCVGYKLGLAHNEVYNMPGK